jgi:iron complex transport system permease protein
MKNSKKVLILIFCIVFFILSFYLALFAGHNNLSITDLIDFFMGKDNDNTQILGLLRMPRVFKAIIAGSCLAISGLFMQTMTKNPLVEPYITGVSSGAGIALVLAILLNLPPMYYSLFAFVGAVVSSTIVIYFAGLYRFSFVKLILIGLSINIFVSSIISMLILANSEKTHSMVVILSGNLNSSIAMIKPIVLMYILGIAACIFIIPKLNFMRIDNDIVSAVNTNAKRYYIFIIVLSSLLAAISVCAAGILGFVGIVIPHISRLLIGQDFRWLFFINMVLGSTIVLFSDFIARNAVYPTEIPLGLVLALIGAPIFIAFLVIKGCKIYA